MNWKRKLSSRKLWVAIAGFVSGLIVAVSGDTEVAATVSGCILQGAAVLGYLLAEGLADAGNNNEDTYNITTNYPRDFLDKLDEKEGEDYL